MYYIILFVFLVIFILMILPIKEQYEPQNSFYESMDDQREIYIKENKFFDIINIEPTNVIPDIDFIPIPQYLKFEYNDIFKNTILEYINNIKDKSLNLSGNVYKITRDPYNIKNTVKPQTNYYKFDIDVINETKRIMHTLNVIIDQKEHQLVGIKNIYETNYKVVPYNWQNMYRIKNTLYLMDPYLTSGKEMAR